jgi:hypothetical protein
MTSFKRFEFKPVVKMILIYERLNCKADYRNYSYGHQLYLSGIGDDEIESGKLTCKN